MSKNIHRKNTLERSHYVLSSRQRLSLKPKLLYAGTLKKSPDWQDEAHSHDFCEIMFITAGAGKITAEGVDYFVKQGDLIIYNSGCVHSETSDKNNPLEMNFFGFKNIKLDSLNPDCITADGEKCVIETGVYSKILGRYIEELVIETEKQQSYYGDISSAILEIILLLILRVLSYGEEKYIKLNDAYLKAKEFIEQNYDKNITLDDVCSRLYISRHYLSHMFKEISGMPVVKYITKVRIEKAKELLLSTDKTVSEIAALTGYADTPYFIRVFKNLEKLTPSMYRNINCK